MIFCLTNAGKEYMARVNAGEISMHLTRAVVGSGSSSYLDILTSVVDEQQQIQLDAVYSDREYTHIECVLTNLELERAYILKQLGIYAADETGEDKLIIIGQDIYGDRVPLISEKEVEYQFNIGMRVSNASEVTFDFSVNDFLRKKYFYEFCEEVDRRFKMLPRVRIGSKQLLDRRDIILLETLDGENKVIRIQERDSEDNQHEYELATLFKMAERRELIKSGETLSVIFGKVLRYLADIKENCFAGADDPFVLMTEATYKPPAKRTKGSLYGLITKIRGLIIIQFDRYVQGLEEPRVERTLYGVETKARGDVEASPYSYIGVIKCIVFVDDESTDVRMQEKLYAKIKETR